MSAERLEEIPADMAGSSVNGEADAVVAEAMPCSATKTKIVKDKVRIATP